MKKTLSVVVTVMNERENISELIKRVDESLRTIDYELIFVDDGSTDGTQLQVIMNLSPRVRLVELRKNYGQSTAMVAGIDHATGDYIATIDGDLQNDPSDIPYMLNKLIEDDWDVVAGERVNRRDGMLLRKIPSAIANAMIRKLTNVHLKDYGCTLKVFRREIAENLGLYGELHRFIPVLASLEGARMTQVPVKHAPRVHGVSKYGINRSFKVLSDLLLVLFLQKYIQKPMHIFGTTGFIILMFGVVLDLYLLVEKLTGHDIWGRPLIVLAMILTLAGIQLITIGIVAEINVRTYFESQSKKTYNVRKIHQIAE